MSMPSGFVRSTGLDFGELPADEGILESLHDPETQASLLVSALRTREDIVSIKNTILKDALARFEAVRVERDAEWNHQAARGWKVELRGELGGISLKQIHLFVRAGERVLIATFTCADALWPRYESELSASLRSLRAADRPIAEPTPPRASVSVPELPAG
ncbi:MAG TPA: hypothetical protein VK116_13345 [Planctomycetota bacterium]|nr:hypothetical protein [Planctomycetota bacterium]